jgi:hypothetical protein
VKIAARPNSNLIWIGDIDGNKLLTGDLLGVNCRLRFRNWTGRKTANREPAIAVREIDFDFMRVICLDENDVPPRTTTVVSVFTRC